VKYNFQISPGTHTEQIGKILMGIERIPARSDTVMGSKFLSSEAKNETPIYKQMDKSDN